MTLIWHSWFATSNQGVASQQLMLNQNDFFRGDALGSFADLLMGVTKDPAMLIWLNGNQNVKGHPNENYGREMMELFTLGADRGAYTETDVRENARALTGWTGSVNKGIIGDFTFVDEPARRRVEDDLRPDGQLHVDGLGEPLPQPSAAPVVLRQQALELLRPDAARQADAAALAALYKGNGFKVHPVVEAILQHPIFYSSPRMVKSPVVLNAGLLRMIGRPIDTAAWCVAERRRGPAALLPAGRRRLGLHALARHGDVARALVHRRARPGHDRADGHLERPGAARRRARSSSGAPRRSRPQTQTLLVGVREGAARSASAAPADVETALRRLVATSPDLQTA